MDKVTNMIKNNNVQKILLDFSDAETLPNIMSQDDEPDETIDMEPTNDEFVGPKATFFRRPYLKAERHIKFTISTNLMFDNIGTCVIDVNQLCNENDCTGIMNCIFLFSQKCKINYVSIVVKDKCIEKITPELNSIIDYTENKFNDNMLMFAPKFFCRNGLILLKNSKIIINIDYMNNNTNMKFIADCIKLPSYDINLNGDFINKIGRRMHYLCYGNNYQTYYIPENLMHNQHTIDLKFSGKLAYIFILLQPYNQKCNMELTGTLLDDNIPVCFFNELINKINCNKLKIMAYNKNIYINQFCNNENVNSELKKSISNSYTILNSTLTLSFVLNIMNDVQCGSMFMHIWAPQFCELKNLIF